MKPIRLTAHAKEQFRYRGTTEDEIIDAIKTSPWNYAELGRFECRKDFYYGNIWNKKFYSTKQLDLFSLKN